MAVVLDEATGNLDVETELALYWKLCADVWPKGGLVVIVTHRPERLIDFHN
jgi:ABC-type protease/lipase transport system fused ATPase/permease subunit